MRVLVSDRKVPSSLDVIVCVVISELDGIGTEDGQLEPKPAHFWCFHCELSQDENLGKHSS